MRKHIILFFSALLFLYACKSDKGPVGIIDEAKMIRLLVDVHIADGSLATQPAGDSLYKYGTGRYEYLFKQYHTDSATFRKSVKYYTTQPDQILEMYNKVAVVLKAKSDSLAKQEEKKAETERKRQAKIAKELEKQKAKLKQDSIRLKKNVIKRDSLKKDSIKKVAKARLEKKKNKQITTTKKNALPQ